MEYGWYSIEQSVNAAELGDFKHMSLVSILPIVSEMMYICVLVSFYVDIRV